MSKFFTRTNNNKSASGLKRKGTKLKVHYPKKGKQTVIPKPQTQVDDEEIPSDDEEIDFKNLRKEPIEEEEILTEAERKKQLAEKVLKEFETDDKDDGETLDKLKEEALAQAGKLRRKILDDFNKQVSVKDIKVFKCKEHKLSVSVVVISSNGKYIYSGSKDGVIVMWTIDGKKVKHLPCKHKCPSNDNLHSSAIQALAVSSDDKYLASCDKGTVIQIWDAATLDHSFSFKGHQNTVTGLAFCKVTQNLYSCSKDKTVKVWSMSEKAYIETLFGHHDAITSVDVLGKGRAVTSGGTDSTCRVWKIEEETQLIYNGNSRSIDCVRRLDDNHFVSSSEDGSLCLWGTLKKKPLAKVESAHSRDPKNREPYWISSIACISNSEIFASGSNDGFVRFWNCADNYRKFTELCSVPVQGFVNSMAFTPDNNHLVLGVGQESRLGRWVKIKEAKNCIVIICNLNKSNR